MTRCEIAWQAVEANEIGRDTFGQLSIESFSDRRIALAFERKWISEEFADRLRKGTR